MEAVIEYLFKCEDKNAPDGFLQRFQKFKQLKRVITTSKQAFVRDVAHFFPAVDNLAELLDHIFELEYDTVETAVTQKKNASEEAVEPATTAANVEEDLEEFDTLPEAEAAPEAAPTETEAVPTITEDVAPPANEEPQPIETEETKETEGERTTEAALTSANKDEQDQEHAAQAAADAKTQTETMKDEEAATKPSTFTSSEKLETRKEGGMSQAILTQHKTFNVWIGDLSLDVVDTDIKEAFASVGEVKNVRCFKDKLSGKNRGFGFIHFADREAQCTVLRADYEAPVIKGRRCRVGPSTEKVTLYIGNIPETANAELLLEKLGEWIGSDNITSLEVKMQDETRCRGFGFLQLIDQHTAFNCLRRLNQNAYRIMDRTLTISMAEPEEDPAQLQSKTVYMSNLDKTFTEEMVIDICKVYGPVTKVTISKDATTSLPRGYCFVEFDRRTDALKAITALHNTKVGENYVQASIAKPRGTKAGFAAPARDIRRDYGNYRTPASGYRGRGGYSDYAGSRAPRGWSGYGGRQSDYYRAEQRGGYQNGGYGSYGGYGSTYGGYGQGAYSGSYGGQTAYNQGAAGYGSYGQQSAYGAQGGYGGYESRPSSSYGAPQRPTRGGAAGGSSRYTPY